MFSSVLDDGTHGGLTGPIVDAGHKAILHTEIAQREGINIQQTVAVGGAANDLNMMHKAGQGIAFNAGPKYRLRHLVG